MRPRRRARAGADAGFLLAETLITFALAALVLAGLVSSAAVLLRANDRSVAVVGTADELGRTLQALTRDISGLRRARWSGEEPQDFVFRGGPNSLSFAQEVPTPDGGRELRVVSLREIVVGAGTVLTRAEAHLPATATGWDTLRFGPARRVPAGPARLRFHYLAERAEGAPAPKPVDVWPSGPTLPAAVIVEAVDAATTRLIVTDTVAVRADADIGCADRTPPRRDATQPATQAGIGAPGTAGPAGLGAVPQGAQPPAPPLGATFEVATNAANANEFCGRADRGLARKPPPQAQQAAGGPPQAPGLPTGARP